MNNWTVALRTLALVCALSSIVISVFHIMNSHKNIEIYNQIIENARFQGKVYLRRKKRLALENSREYEPAPVPENLIESIEAYFEQQNKQNQDIAN